MAVVHLRRALSPAAPWTRATPASSSRCWSARRPGCRSWRRRRHITCRFVIVDAPHSHAASSSRRRLGGQGRGAGADEGQPAQRRIPGRYPAPNVGLRTERRLTHCFHHGDGRPTRAPSSSHRRRHQHRPTLDDKADIVRNAIDPAMPSARPSPASPYWPWDGDRQRAHARYAGRRRAKRWPTTGQITRPVLGRPAGLRQRRLARRRRAPRASSRKWQAAPTLIGARPGAAICWPKTAEYMGGADSAGIVMGACAAHGVDQPPPTRRRTLPPRHRSGCAGAGHIASRHRDCIE